MEKIYDICARVSTYEKNGETKGRYVNVGCIYKNDSGNPFIFLHAWFNPAGIERKQGSEGIFLSLFPPRDSSSQPVDPLPRSNQQSQSQPQRQQQQPQQNPNAFSEWPEIPF